MNTPTSRAAMACLMLATAAFATPAHAQDTPVSPGSNAVSGGNLPTSGSQNGMGTPTGTGLGSSGNATLVAPGGGNGFQNNTSLNGSSGTGPATGGGATTP